MRQLDLYKYNPGRCRPEDLEATFVARNATLGSILDVLRERATAPANQHFLITGPRGSGKTNMLLMIKYGLEKDEALSQAYLPLQTAEEEYSIASLRDLFTKILELLLEAVSDEDLREAAESVHSTDDDEQAADFAIHEVKSFCARASRKILLLLDNFDLILEEKVLDEAQMGLLRDLLMNDSFLELVATAPTHFKEVSGYDRPFYQFFQTIDLEELTLEEITELLKKQADLENNRTLLDRFKEVQPRIQAIHHLTGGNPRLALMLYQLFTHSELPEVRASIQALLDDLTPYYKHRIEVLAPQQRKVLDTFARLGRPATPTELAKEIRLPVNQINSILKRLRELGFVSVSPQKRRKTTLYIVSERVFRVWHQMRFSTVGRRKLEFLIEFLRIWYSEREWKGETKRLMGEYRKAAAEKQLDHAGGFIEHLEYLAEAAPDAKTAYSVLDDTIRTCIESKDFQRAEKIINERIRIQTNKRNNNRLAQCWHLKAYLHYAKSERDNEIAALEKAVYFRPDFHEALFKWGTYLGELARTRKGKEQERLLTEAIEKYEAAVKVKPDFHEALYNWGTNLGDLARTRKGKEQERLFDDSVQKINAAIELASSQDDKESVAYYSGHFINVTLLRCEIAIETENSGQTRSLFNLALDHLHQARGDLALTELTNFFLRIVEVKTAGICMELFDFMQKRNLTEPVGVLGPIRKAVEYWQSDEKTRDELLDRLNPEVRKVVEAIIKSKT